MQFYGSIAYEVFDIARLSLHLCVSHKPQTPERYHSGSYQLSLLTRVWILPVFTRDYNKEYNGKMQHWHLQIREQCWQKNINLWNL